MRSRLTVLTALANGNCLGIVAILRAEHTVTEIIQKTGLPQTCVSHCLKRLTAEGVVSVRRDGRFRRYKNTRTVEPLLKALDSHIGGRT